MNPTPAEMESGMSRSQMADAAGSASGTPEKTSRAFFTFPNHGEQQRQRHDNLEALRRGDKLLDGPPKVYPIAGRDLDRFHPFLSLGDEWAEVASAHVGRDDCAAFPVLAADLIGTGCDVEFRGFTERERRRAFRLR